MKKTVFVLLLLLAVLLAACANVSLPPEEAKTPEQIMESLAQSLPQTSQFEGRTLTVYTPSKDLFLGNDEEAGAVRSALKRRNQLLEHTYGIELSVVEVPENEIASVLQKAKQEGKVVCDLLCYSAETTAKLRDMGLLADLTGLPYFAVNACNDPAAAVALKTGDSLYLLPDPAAQCYEEAYLVFYDRDLLRQYGLELPETLVKNGSWTMETFKKYAETVGASVLNKETVDYRLDVFGYGFADAAKTLPYLLWCAQGTSLFTRTENGTMGIACSGEQIASLATQAETLYRSKARLQKEGAESRKAFKEGRCGFYIAKLSYIKEVYATSERDYGMVPLPKADASREGYYAPVSEKGRVLSVPAGCIDERISGLGLAAICTVGGPVLQNAVRETYVSLYSLDNDQSCMLEMVLDSACFDFGWVYGTQNDATYRLSRGMFADVFSGNGSYSSALRNGKDAFSKYASQNYR